MSTFSYSRDQIDKIFESANRSGQIRKDWFKLNDHDNDVIYDQLARERKEKRKKKKEEEKKKEKDKNTDNIAKLQKDLDKNLEEKQEIEQEIKQEILQNILKHDFTIKITQEDWYDDPQKKIYVTGKDRDSFFACKIINDELQKTYKINQPNRNVILKNLMLLLSDKVEKMVVRGDIKSFFESIPRERLFVKIEKDGIVSHRSIKLMKRMFYELSQKYDYSNGVPRGISFSPSLADIYLRDIDTKISQLDGIYLYQRYVDDVIIIASPTTETPTAKSLFNKVEHIFKEGELILHPEGDGEKYMAKDIHYDIPQKIVFDYLGYNITLNTKTAEVQYKLTKSRIDKYTQQIDKVINYYKHVAIQSPRKKKKEEEEEKDKEKKDEIIKDYEHVETQNPEDIDKKKNSMRHRQPLYRLNKLLGYLTRNYRLGGTKSNILSGVYFKHSMLTDTIQLKRLDEILYKKFDVEITQKIFDGKFDDRDFVNKLRKKVHQEYSFEKGFTERRMCHFTSADFKMVKHILQYEEKKN